MAVTLVTVVVVVGGGESWRAVTGLSLPSILDHSIRPTTLRWSHDPPTMRCLYNHNCHWIRDSNILASLAYPMYLTHDE